jgi:hypothetical protein
MTAALAWSKFIRVTPNDELFAHDPDRTTVMENARLAARTAHEIAGPPLVSALGYLASLSDNSLLPVELRYRAKQAALRMAEAAIHLECLPEVFNAEHGEGQNAGVTQLRYESVSDQLGERWMFGAPGSSKTPSAPESETSRARRGRRGKEPAKLGRKR